MCCSDSCIISIISGVILGFLTTGVVLWTLGEKYESSRLFETFTKLPLVPISNSFPIEQYLIGFDKAQETISINISIPNSDIFKKDIYLLHNMWSYDINFTLFSGDNLLAEISLELNNFSDAYEPLHRKSIQSFSGFSKSLSKIQVAADTYLVSCPYSYAATSDEQYKQCESSPYPMKVNGNYSIQKLKENDMDVSSLTFRFTNSIMTPYNYVETPEAYIIFFTPTVKTAIRTAGIVITSIAIVGAVAFIVIIIILVLFA